MQTLFSIFIAAVITSGCTQPNDNGVQKKIIDKVWLNSIIINSDSSYAKAYKRSHFDSAFYFINKKDSSICQVMKDSFQTIRQVIIMRKNVRSLFAAYYANGQLQADLSLDEFGQYHGNSTSYYPSGLTESSGKYEHGIKTGPWKYFDNKGRLLSTNNYDKNGQLIK